MCAPLASLLKTKSTNLGNENVKMLELQRKAWYIRKRVGKVKTSFQESILIRCCGSYNFKVGLSTSKKICLIYFNESPSKMMKNTFYFILRIQ